MFQQILVDWVFFHSRTMVFGILQNWFLVYSRTGFQRTLELVSSVLQNWFLVYYRTGFQYTLELVSSVLQNWFLVYSRTGFYCTLELVSSVLQNWFVVYSRTGLQCTLELVYIVLQNWFLVYSRTGLQCTLELVSVSTVLRNRISCCGCFCIQAPFCTQGLLSSLRLTAIFKVGQNYETKTLFCYRITHMRSHTRLTEFILSFEVLIRIYS